MMVDFQFLTRVWFDLRVNVGAPQQHNPSNGSTPFKEILAEAAKDRAFVFLDAISQVFCLLFCD